MLGRDGHGAHLGVGALVDGDVLRSRRCGRSAGGAGTGVGRIGRISNRAASTGCAASAERDAAAARLATVPERAAGGAGAASALLPDAAAARQRSGDGLDRLR